MSAHVPRIPCGHCGGKGSIELPDHLAAILEHIRKHGSVTAREFAVASADDIGVTAVNNRLETLRKLGLVFRRRIDGRSVRYFLEAVRR